MQEKDLQTDIYEADLTVVGQTSVLQLGITGIIS